MRPTAVASVLLACIVVAASVAANEELAQHNVKMLYVVESSRSPEGAGAIYLRGHGDERYRLNIGTIFRQGRNGKWFPASDEWERVVGSRLPGARGTRQP